MKLFRHGGVFATQGGRLVPNLFLPIFAISKADRTATRQPRIFLISLNCRLRTDNKLSRPPLNVYAKVTYLLFNAISKEKKSKRSLTPLVRIASQPDWRPQKKLAGDSGAAGGVPTAYSDAETDFSNILCSPLRPRYTGTSSDSGSKQPSSVPAATRDAPSAKLLQEAVRAELKSMLRETLPGMLCEMMPVVLAAMVESDCAAGRSRSSWHTGRQITDKISFVSLQLISCSTNAPILF